MRQLRNFIVRWRIVVIACLVTYCCVLYLPLLFRGEKELENREKLSGESRAERILNQKNEQKEFFEFAPVGEEPFFVEELVTKYDITLKEKFTCKANKNAPPKLILSWNAGHDQSNLGGCPEWNCHLTRDRNKLNEADAVMLMAADPGFHRRDSDQYTIFFSQESPKNSGFGTVGKDYFNMSLGYRHDSPTASPYGYTVKLAPQSRKTGPVIDRARVEGKKKGAAWFVSHCTTNSDRESVVNSLKKHFEVDIFGACGTQRCPKRGACEDALDTDYHFYIAFENSLCQDYLTEKLWNQGYKRDIIPLVMKRSTTKPLVPPNSFIALDDFATTREMAAYLSYLMRNKTAYMQYFEWRHDYKVIFLDGSNHDVLEKPWGFCQICRLMWEQPKLHYTIPNFNEYWYDTCEIDGALARPILADSRKEDEQQMAKKQPKNDTMSDRIQQFNAKQNGLS